MKNQYIINDYTPPEQGEGASSESDALARKGGYKDVEGKIQLDEKAFVKYLLSLFCVIYISGMIAFYNWRFHIYEFIDEPIYLSFFKEILDEMSPSLWSTQLESKLKVRFKREIKVKLKEFQIPTDFVVFSNGAFRLSDGKFQEGDHPSEIFNTCCTGYDYDYNAECPTFESFLDDVFNHDKNLIKVVQEMMGYTLLYGENPLQVIVLLIGEGRNGKGILTSICQMIHGQDNCSGTSISQLNSQFGLSQMYDKVLNVSNENDENVVTDTSILKTISGNDTVMVERKYHDAFPAEIHCKLWIATNGITFLDSSKGFEERLVPIPFENTYVNKPIPGTNQKKRDSMLLEKLEEEKSGIFNWMYEGLVRLRDNKWKITESDAVLQQRMQIVEDSNPVQLFVNRFLVKEDGARMRKPNTYRSFKEWSRVEGINVGIYVSAQKFYPKFNSILEGQGYSSKTKRIQGVDYYTGFYLKEITIV